MTATEYATRSQDEIVARIKMHEQSAADAMFGWSREVLVDALDYEHAKPYLKDEVTAEDWETARTVDTEAAAKAYLSFAIEKIDGHRGLSAERSAQKLVEYAWLLGRDDVVAAMEAADYPQYGAPKVKAFADGMGWPWPDGEDFARMARGERCSADCDAGCGL